MILRLFFLRLLTFLLILASHHLLSEKSRVDVATQLLHFFLQSFSGAPHPLCELRFLQLLSDHGGLIAEKISSDSSSAFALYQWLGWIIACPHVLIYNTFSGFRNIFRLNSQIMLQVFSFFGEAVC